MKIYIFIAIIILKVSTLNVYAQQTLSSGAKKYANYAFIDAIKTYERVAKKGYKSEEVFKKLANSYYYNSDYRSAAKWYSELYGMSDKQDSEYDYRYAQCLKSIGQVKKANIILEKLRLKDKNDNRGILFKEEKNYIKKINANSGRYIIKDSGINSKFSDYGSFVVANKIYFASAKDTGNFIKIKHRWTDEYFTHLYIATLDSTGKKEPVIKKVEISSNSKFNQCSAVITKDGKTAYFTGNDYDNSGQGKEKKKITLLKIYQATIVSEKWVDIKELPFNSNSYSTAHPALSPDEKTLFFVSDRPGTLGQSDIFKVSIDDNGLFGQVKNLGPTINTEGRESYPFISKENEIYFASDGHPGLGGFDVFVGKLEPDYAVCFIQNLGSDINSVNDDFAYFIDSDSGRGYFSSNKDGGKGSDDIYSFVETKKLQPEREELNGYIRDSETTLLLPGAIVKLYDKNMVLKNTVVADSTANYSFFVEEGESYKVRVEMPDYFTKELKIKVEKQNKKKEFAVYLDKSKCKIIVGDDLGKCFGIKMIYFDLNKSEIKYNDVIDLEKILDVLNQHPTMKLEIRSHTDSRQTYKYNQDLSDRRAKSTFNWFIKNGVAPERLTAKGFGESQLLNKCTDGVKCTEEEHQVNRRSEFLVKEL